MSLLPLVVPRPLRRSAAVALARSGLLTLGAADAVGRRGGVGRNAPCRVCEKRMVPGLTPGEAALGTASARIVRALSHLHSMLSARIDRPVNK